MPEKLTDREARILRDLVTNCDGYTEGRVSTPDFMARALALWGEANAAGRESSERIARAVCPLVGGM